MSTFDQLKIDVVDIKNTANELSQMLANAEKAVESERNNLAVLFQGQQGNGQKAVGDVTAAARSIGEASVNMSSLGRSCDDYLRVLQSS